MIQLNVSNFQNEAKKFLSLGLPILGTQIVMYGLTTTDYIMAGYYSSDDLAGLGLAASIFNPIYFLTAGVMFGINPIIAQLYGKRDFEQIKVKTTIISVFFSNEKSIFLLNYKIDHDLLIIIV